MIKSKSIVIIPCKMDSERLKGKNLSLIGDKTLLEHSILYARKSKYVEHIIVSTESDEVRDICKKYEDVLVHDRPKHLLKDADTVDVYVDVVRLFNTTDITHIVGLQPDNPDRQRSLDEVLEYFVTKKYDDLVTVGTDGTRNGSVRVIKSKFVRMDNVSRRVGSLQDDCTNIHTEDDLKIATERISND
jgi:CMP-N-acetylneuraminic acid synthetase